MKYLLISLLITGGWACSSKSLTPNVDEVKMSRNNPSSECEEIGRVTGRTMTAKGTSEEAMNDMRDEASKKGANFVRIEQYSGTGTSVTGVAYRCP
jgi:hypothetical protein